MSSRDLMHMSDRLDKGLSRRLFLGATTTGLATRRGRLANAQSVSKREGKPRYPLIAASALRDGWGVCVHLDGEATSGQYADMLTFLGTSHVRGPLMLYGRSMLPQYEALEMAMRHASGSVARQNSTLTAPEPVLRCDVLIEAYLNDRNKQSHRRRRHSGTCGHARSYCFGGRQHAAVGRDALRLSGS